MHFIVQMGRQDDSTDCYCPDEVITYFQKEVNAQLRLSDVLMAANAILVGFLVAVCAFGRRYRHAALVRILFLGASTLYLPAVSYVISSIGKENRNAAGLVVLCKDQGNLVLLLLWTVLVQIVGTNATDIIAVDDGDGQKLGPSVELLARTIWTSYLVFFYSRGSFYTFTEIPYVNFCKNIGAWPEIQIFPQIEPMSRLLIVLCVLSLSKITLKFFAFEKARRSFALGRNAPLVAGYMEQLQAERHRASEDELIPPLLVMGEEKQKIEERPLGYGLIHGNSMVTVDRVWQLASSTDNVHFVSHPWLKDLCLSFALFKMLRRRFAKCRLAESGSYKAFNFVLNALLNNGDPDRVFRVIADEVSFVADSYFSSLPTSHFGRLLPILNIIVSLSIITCCLVLGDLVISLMQSRGTQMTCSTLSCFFEDEVEALHLIDFGNMFFSSTPVMFLIAASVLAEAWEIVSYLCSNWIKVTLLCSYVTHVSWQQSPLAQRCLGLLLKFRVNFIKIWDDQTGQISLLAHPHPKIYDLRRLFFRFSDPGVQYVKVPAEVKASIVSALRISNGSLSNGTAALHGSEIGTDVRWACDGEGTSDVILVWHIATGIFEARHTTSTSSSAGNKTAATHLSRYCVYLMAATPELLPDDEAWSKKLYKTVRADIDRVLPSRRHEGKLLEYDQMIALLSERSDHHEVVKRGVRLGKQLVELIQDEETGWGVLAGFWSEMILYIAPSDNLKAHKEAIARGGELVTLIWALLTHAGIVTRPNTHTAV